MTARLLMDGEPVADVEIESVSYTFNASPPKPFTLDDVLRACDAMMKAAVPRFEGNYYRFALHPDASARLMAEVVQMAIRRALRRGPLDGVPRTARERRRLTRALHACRRDYKRWRTWARALRSDEEYAGVHCLGQ